MSYPNLEALQGMPAPVLDRQIHVVMGKGGVGKSSVALALALGLHARGRKVLLCQVHAADAHGGILGAPVTEELSQPRPGLWAVNIDPVSARREYVMMVLKFRALYDAIFDNRLVQYFLRFIPSLAELNMTGKVWFHACEQEQGRPRFDHVVVDAPATGHGVTLIRVGRVLSHTAPPGPLRTQTEQMAAVFEDPTRTALHVVATPDELSVAEGEELLTRLRGENVGPLGSVLLNRVPAPLFINQDVAPWRQLRDNPQLAALASVVLDRAQTEATVLAALQRLAKASGGAPVLALPELLERRFGQDQVQQLGSVLAPPRRVVEAL